MSQSYLTAARVEPASRLTAGRRVTAFIIDMIILAILGWSAVFIILIFGILTLGLGWLMFHIVPWIPLVYYTAFISSGGASPGQRLCGIAVRQEANLLPPTLPQALVWTLLLGLSFCLGGIPFILALIPPFRAGHDLLSGLAVIRPADMRLAPPY